MEQKSTPGPNESKSSVGGATSPGKVSRKKGDPVCRTRVKAVALNSAKRKANKKTPKTVKKQQRRKKTYRRNKKDARGSWLDDTVHEVQTKQLGLRSKPNSFQEILPAGEKNYEQTKEQRKMREAPNHRQLVGWGGIKGKPGARGGGWATSRRENINGKLEFRAGRKNRKEGSKKD